jgi:excinuclease ABC subunit C
MRQAARFLSGEVTSVVRDLERRMREASETLQYERAARLRDRLRAIEDTVQRQVAISTDVTDRDVIGAKLPDDDGDTALLQVLFVRAGRLIDQRSFTVRQAAGRDLGEVVGEFLIHYYQRATFVPKEVLVPAEPVDAEVLAEWLGRARGSRVTIHVPQRGEKRRLVALAMENAVHAAKAEEETARTDEERGLARVAALQAALALPSPPNRIECYDISTLGGRESVGSMAVFIGGRPAPGEGRGFTVIAETPASDDYAMMREVLGRRFARLRAGDAKFGGVPDLVLVDGGKGQLSCAAKVMGEMGLEIPLASLAKRREEVYVPGRSTPVVLKETDEGLKLLMHIRDQAHRLAITHHRGRRSRAATKSVLDDIPGIGPKRKQALLERFASIRAICDATVDELAAVPGLDTKLAQEVLRRLRPVGSVAKHTAHRAPVPVQEATQDAQGRQDGGRGAAEPVRVGRRRGVAARDRGE